MQHITLIVATMTGTSELVADEVAGELSRLGHETKIVPCDVAGQEIFAEGGVFLIISSTYGNGDVPDNAQAFFAATEAARPDLSNIVYGLIALGDMTYRATFCQGGRKFDKLFAELGARRLGAPLLHDASAGTAPEEEARAWVANWVQSDLPASRQAA